MKFRIPAVAAAVACMLALTSGPALAATTLDQSQTDVSGYADAWTVSGMRLGQTFKAGITGPIARVDVDATSPGSVDFEVVGATILDEQTVTLKSSGWTQITLTTPANVSKTALYYIILVPSDGQITWQGSCSNVYSGGTAYILDKTWSTIPAWNAAHGKVFAGFCEQDFAFKTYVTTAAAPTPTKAPTAKPGTTAAAKATATPTPAPTPTPTPAAGASDTASASPAATDTAAASPTATGAAAAATAANPGQSSSSGSGSGSGGTGGSALPIILALVAVLVVAGGGVWFFVLRRREA